MKSVLISCQSITKSYGEIPVLGGVSVDFRHGEVAVIVGPSGSGKSTFLRTLNCLDPHDGGSIHIDGIEVKHGAKNLQMLRSQVGMVFQQFNLFPHLTVRQNLMLAPRRVLGLSTIEATELAMELLCRVGMQAHATKYPFQLSGGQQQRIAIARALAMKPRVMLFDEPTSALDPEMVNEVLDVMKELAASGMTMLVVTHEMSFARQVADRILFLDRGQIAIDARPEAFFGSHQSDRVLSFLGQIRH